MSEPNRAAFAQLVSLACHDLRTPLATVAGFAKTLTRLDGVGDPVARYLGMIEAASQQLADLLDDLATAARIEGHRWDPHIREVDSLELVRDAVEPLEDAVEVEGTGAPVAVEVDAAHRAIYGLARCAIRHGGLERLAVEVAGPVLTLAPVPADAHAICLGADLRDLGAAVGVRALAALGGATETEGETLVVRLPLAPVVS
jgi:signal transduction histidine kinase